MPWDKLKNAPIKEAVFNLRFENPISDSVIESFNKKVRKEYPDQNEKMTFNVDIKSTGPPITTPSKKDGYRLSHSEKSEPYIILNTPSSFTLSRLRPYETWEKLKTEGFRLVKILFELDSKISVNRIALRYINEFQLSFPSKENQSIGHFVRLLPVVPNELPKQVEGYSIQLSLPKTKDDLKSNISLRISPTDTEETYNVIFDIDVYKQHHFGNDIALIKKDLETIREYKNLIFYKSITPNTVKLFN